MKLTGRLKKEVDNIDTKEGKKEAIRKAGMLVSDSELEQVSGGIDFFRNCFTCLNNYGGDACQNCSAYKG